MGLLDKFASIQADPKERLSNEDMAYCDRLTKEANEVLASLKEQWDITSEKFKNENLGYEINSFRYISKPTGMWDDGFKRYRFSHSFDTLHIQNLVTGLVHVYKTRIIDYFANKYNLTLDAGGKMSSWRDGFRDEAQFQELDYAEIMEYITKCTGGLNFREVGEQKFIEDFSRNFWTWRTETVKHTIKGATMKIDSFYTIHQHWNSGYRYKNDATYLQIERALNFFETLDLGNTSGDRTLSGLIDERCDFTEIYFSDLTKTSSIRFFKNGRVDIKFASATYANEFSNLYKLDSLGTLD